MAVPGPGPLVTKTYAFVITETKPTDSQSVFLLPCQLDSLNLFFYIVHPFWKKRELLFFTLIVYVGVSCSINHLIFFFLRRKSCLIELVAVFSCVCKEMQIKVCVCYFILLYFLKSAFTFWESFRRLSLRVLSWTAAGIAMTWCACWRKGILMWGGGSGEKWAKRSDGCLGLREG